MPDEVVPQVQPSWVGSTDNIVKLLLQGNQPTAVPEDMPIPTAPAQTQTGYTPSLPMPLDFSNIQPKVGASELHGKVDPRKVPPVVVPKVSPVGQIPVTDVIRMYSHELSPHVEAAKQRVLQALMQKTHAATHTVPATTKGTL